MDGIQALTRIHVDKVEGPNVHCPYPKLVDTMKKGNAMKANTRGQRAVKGIDWTLR